MFSAKEAKQWLDEALKKAGRPNTKLELDVERWTLDNFTPDPSAAQLKRFLEIAEDDRLCWHLRSLGFTALHDKVGKRGLKEFAVRGVACGEKLIPIDSLLKLPMEVIKSKEDYVDVIYFGYSLCYTIISFMRKMVRERLIDEEIAEKYSAKWPALRKKFESVIEAKHFKATRNLDSYNALPFTELTDETIPLIIAELMQYPEVDLENLDDCRNLIRDVGTMIQNKFVSFMPPRFKDYDAYKKFAKLFLEHCARFWRFKLPEEIPGRDPTAMNTARLLHKASRSYVAMAPEIMLTYYDPKFSIKEISPLPESKIKVQCVFVRQIIAPVHHLCSGCARDVANLKCGRCGWARYCSQECQKGHWPSHKKFCGKVSLEELEKRFVFGKVPWLEDMELEKL